MNACRVIPEAPHQGTLARSVLNGLINRLAIPPPVHSAQGNGRYGGDTAVSHTRPARMDNKTSGTTHHNTVCPFCGLCCDDLTVRVNVDEATVTANGCTLGARGFAQPAADTRQPLIQGKTCTVEQAVQHAAGLLRSARLPLFGGLGTDVDGARAAIKLADHIGATLDHMNSEALLRNLLAVQDSGWMTCTLTEVRNRADLLVMFGSSAEQRLPRFYERFFNNQESMFGLGADERRLVLIGDGAASSMMQGDPRVTAIPCPTHRLGDIAAAMRTLLRGRPLQQKSVAGVSVVQLQDLVNRLAHAHYGVIGWLAAELDFPHAELAVQAISALAVDLNSNTRCSGLPLGGNNGDTTFVQVATSQTGYPTRISLGGNQARYGPLQNATDRLLADNEADILVWISAFDAERKPPASAIPGIVLGHAAMQCDPAPEVFFPVATPGIDHAGNIYRCDSAVNLPLRALRSTGLPAVAAVLNSITGHL